MTTPTAVDMSAPVVAHHVMDMKASLDSLWQLHIDVNSCPSWQQAITEAHMDRAFEPGNSFSWSSYDFAVTSQIYEVTDRSRTLWGGYGERHNRHPRVAFPEDRRRRSSQYKRVLRG
jgi:hypothetical protein